MTANEIPTEESVLEAIRKVALKFEQVSPILLALGEENRQKIILILTEAGIDGLNVSEITEKTHLSRPAVSHHLKILKDAKLLRSYKKGTQNFYALFLGNSLDKAKDLINSIEAIIEQFKEQDREKIEQIHWD